MAYLGTNDSALARGIRTFLQALIGLVAGLWLIPGVQTYVTTSLGNYVGGAAGVSAIIGVVSFLWNVLRRDVPNV